MADDQYKPGSVEGTPPVPRDMPDQQAGTGEDPWDVAPVRDGDTDGSDVPDTDEAGTSRRSAKPAGGSGATGTADDDAQGEQDPPSPDESSA